MGLVTWIRSRFDLTANPTGAVSTWPAATGYPVGTMPLESVNTNLVVGAGALGWHPLAGQVYFFDNTPSDATGLTGVNEIKYVNMTFYLPFQANLHCKTVFDLEYSGPNLLQEYTFNFGKGTNGADGLGLSKVVRCARNNVTDAELYPTRMKWIFTNVVPGSTVIAFRYVSGGGAGVGKPLRGKVFIHAVPIGNLMQVNSAQSG